MSSTEERIRFEKILQFAKETESYNEQQALEALKEIGIVDEKGQLSSIYR